MRLDAIAIGSNPPEDVNVVIEVEIGGEPIKYEMDKEAGTLFVDRFLASLWWVQARRLMHPGRRPGFMAVRLIDKS